MLGENENRTERIALRVTKSEKEFIEKKCELSGCKNISDFMRKMAIMGMTIYYEANTLKNLNKQLRNITNNINQIAARVNTSNEFYAEDLELMQEEVDLIWQALKSVQSALQQT